MTILESSGKLQASITVHESNSSDKGTATQALLFEHNLCEMSQFACAQIDKSYFAYLTCEGPDTTMRCHMYQASEIEMVTHH